MTLLSVNIHDAINVFRVQQTFYLKIFRLLDRLNKIKKARKRKCRSIEII